MKYRPSTEGKEIVQKDYRKKVIFSPADFDEPGHLLQVVTIPPHTRQRMHSHDKQTEVFYILESEATITINDVDYLAYPGVHLFVRPAMFTIYGIKRTKTSGWSSLRSISPTRKKTRTGRSNNLAFMTL